MKKQQNKINQFETIIQLQVILQITKLQGWASWLIF